VSISRLKWSHLFRFRHCLTLFILIFVSIAVTAYVGFLTPAYLAKIPKTFGTPFFAASLLALFLIFVMTAVFRILFEWSINKLVQLFIAHIRLFFYNRWLIHEEGGTDSTGKQRSDKYPQGEIISRLFNDTEALRELVSTGTLGVLMDIILVLFCVMGLLQIHSAMGLIIVVFIVIIGLFMAILGRSMRSVFLKVRLYQGRMSKAISNVLGGLSEHYYERRSFRNSHYVSDRSKKSFDEYLSWQIRANYWDAGYYSMAEAIYPILLLVVAVFVPSLAIASVATLLALVDVLARSIDPLKSIAGKIASLQRAATALERLGSFFSDFSYANNKLVEESSPEVVKATFHLKDFSYQNETGRSFSLKEMKVTLYQGKLLGIVGFSGAGKSTLLNVLAGRLLPEYLHCHFIYQDGDDFEVLFDEDSHHRLRSSISLISQEGHLFSESLRFNITLGRESEDFDSFWQWMADKISYLCDWGLTPESLIQPHLLSLGQKELLCAIRSCYLKKKIVLFDEISQSLDGELERAITAVIRIIQKDAMTVIVAHRLESVMDADNILVMDGGAIVSEGTHEELLRSSPHYNELIKQMQLKTLLS